MKSAFVGVRLPPELLKQIDALAEDDFATRSTVIRFLIEKGISNDRNQSASVLEARRGAPIGL